MIMNRQAKLVAKRTKMSPIKQLSDIPIASRVFCKERVRCSSIYTARVKTFFN